MIKLLIIWLFGLLQPPKSDSLPEITSLNLAATKAVAADNTLFYVRENILYLKTDTDTFSFLPQSNVLDIATYGGLINAVLTQDQRLIVLDNKLNPVYSLNLDNADFVYATKVRFCNGSQVAIYDGFDHTLKVTDFVMRKVTQSFRLSGQIRDFYVWKNRVYLLDGEKLLTIDLNTGAVETNSGFDCQSLIAYGNTLILLCNEKLVFWNAGQTRTLHTARRFKKIGGILQSGLLLQNPADSLFVLKLNVTGL